MKQLDAEAGGRKLLPLWASRVTAAAAMASCALIAAPAAKAMDDIETFSLSGSLSGLPFGPPVAFNGAFALDFGDNFANFADPSLKSFDITVDGRSSVFDQGSSVSLGFISASNSTGDTLALLFSPSTWTGFETGDISFGYVVFGGNTGSLLDAGGVITRIAGPTITDPSPSAPSATVPEPSTWTMMLVGLAGLGLAAKGRRALAFLGGRR